ncbi:APC family permease [Streptomyces sp. NPDC002952]|uniref:APC family permease n=1 Tax=Streptomyces sp. NPDC002952 TaxID=3364673 RepID=UPI00367F284A
MDSEDADAGTAEEFDWSSHTSRAHANRSDGQAMALPGRRPGGTDGLSEPLEAEHLATFGYRQELSRSLGSFSAFAAGFSFASILTTAFQLFGLGYSFGGSRLFWSWLAVFLGQSLVALCFAELASCYPLAGSVYEWTKYVGGSFISWLAGWLMLIGCILAFGAAAIALRVVLPALYQGFQIVGNDPSITSSSGATNAVLLGLILIALTTTANAAGVRIVAPLNDIGVVSEILGLAVLLGGLVPAAVRGPRVVVIDHHARQSASPGTAGLLMAALMPAYVMYGFDNAASVAEETMSPRKTAPRAVLRALALSGVIGLALLLLALMAAPSLTDGRLATQGVPYVIANVLDGTLGKVLLADVALAVMVCTLTIQTGTVRLFYAMGRDSSLPFSQVLAKVSPRTGAPVCPAVISGALASGMLLVIWQPHPVRHSDRDVGSHRLLGLPAGHRTPAAKKNPRPLSVGRAWTVLTFTLRSGDQPGSCHLWPAYGSQHRLAAALNLPAGSGRWWSLLFPVEFVAAVSCAGCVCWFFSCHRQAAVRR